MHEELKQARKEANDQRCRNERWLPRLGSNQGFQLQRLTCYRYTTGQCEVPVFIVTAGKASVKD